MKESISCDIISFGFIFYHIKEITTKYTLLYNKRVPSDYESILRVSTDSCKLIKDLQYVLSRSYKEKITKNKTVSLNQVCAIDHFLVFFVVMIACIQSHITDLCNKLT